jgi:hypothetical protein
VSGFPEAPRVGDGVGLGAVAVGLGSCEPDARVVPPPEQLATSAALATVSRSAFDLMRSP